MRDRPTLETCLDVATLSLGLVMAGTGDLDALRVMRAQRKRLDAGVTYGNHMAIHMAIGMLFLGGGRYTLSRSNGAIAALVCSLYPRFSLNTSANRYYLQAFRHLYVLAIEPHCVNIVDVDTQEPCHVPLKVTLSKNDTSGVEEPSGGKTVLSLVAPCLVPDYHLIKEISIQSPRYWSRVVKVDGKLAPQTIYVKRKPGFLPYDVDPTGSWSIAARASYETSAMVPDKSFAIKPSVTSIPRHGQDIDVHAFVQHVCDSSVEGSVQQVAFFGGALRDCLINEKVDILPVFLTLQHILQNLKENIPQHSHSAWDARLIVTYVNGPVSKSHAYTTQKGVVTSGVISSDLVAILVTRFDEYFSRNGLGSADGVLSHYIDSGDVPTDRDAAGVFNCMLSFYGIPDLKSLQIAKAQFMQIKATRIVGLAPEALLALLLPGAPSSAVMQLAPVFFAF